MSVLSNVGQFLFFTTFFCPTFNLYQFDIEFESNVEVLVH